MDINKLERANTLAKGLLPKVNKLLDIHGYSDGLLEKLSNTYWI